jgi:hypothetical protein
MAAFDCFGGYQGLQSVPWRTPTPVGVPLPLCSPAANQHNVFHMSSLRSKVELRIVHATGALLGGAMTQEGRIRRRFRQSRVATVELLIMVLLAGTLLGPCVRSTPESGSAARPRSTPEPDSGPTKAPTPEPDSEPTPEPDSGSTPEPTPSPPDPGRERVDEAIGLLESGVVSYRPPRSMREGESEDLVVLVQRDSTQGDPEDVPGEGPVVETPQDVGTSMAAKLVGGSFEIQPAGDVRRVLGADRPAEWNWTINQSAPEQRSCAWSSLFCWTRTATNPSW